MTLLTTAMLVAGAVIRTGYPHELLVNVGAGMAMVIATYVILEPLIQDLRKPDVEKHSRLDFPAFFRAVEGARSTVAILETGTPALGHQYLREFRAALGEAFDNDVAVRMLLLDPDSSAAEQRTEELGGHTDIRELVTDNLRHLAQIGSEARGQLEVRLYSATPSVQMYRWDDKAFLSFYPVGRLSDDSEQLEVFLASPWGQFVQARFAELWDDRGTRDITDYFRLGVRLWYEGEENGDRTLRYVWHDDAYYVPSADLGGDALFLDSRRLELHTTQHPLWVGREAYTKLRLDRVDQREEAHTLDRVTALFGRKYGQREKAVVRLIPTAHG
ncbi:hypothetical protein R8Z50_10480 [Longispora sp. K20-0274]|uniref:hypothetical protein n=1 Tax=Longispora sp. K20-0274 TaxID=3088255 RepID=UPI00399981F1